MENHYNAILILFIVIVGASIAGISFTCSQYLPELKEGQVSTQIYSPFNNPGDSIYKSRATIILEKFFARSDKHKTVKLNQKLDK